jgi:hypothetical protein
VNNHQVTLAKNFVVPPLSCKMLSVGERGHGNTRHIGLNNLHKISIARLKHIKLKSNTKCLTFFITTRWIGSKDTTILKSEKHHDTTELHFNRFARRHTPKQTTTLIL